ncbi:hypothetical protein PVAG01_11150 [Phlyctema vagabunda]|uniref:MARVEL domain-containing protein n=1 Tax=Phlyctema vagabunda TaxID=108571 RepID=A0ABR4P1G9_9HELO
MGIFSGLELTLAYILQSVFRFIQFVMALVVCGLYGTDLSKANKMGKYSDGKWIYAEVVGALAAFTALLYMIPFMMRVPMLFVWDTILFILWIALFGVFGNMYIKEHAEGNAGITRMKNAVWIDLVNALLWLTSAVGMTIHWVKNRHNRSRFTGRATV